MTRTGKDYLESLRDGRVVWLDGERVDDLPTHPAFRRTLESIADLYDMAADPAHADALTTTVPGIEQPVLRAYQIPGTAEELQAKGRAFKLWAERTYGFLGRSPDYMASAVAAFASCPEVFAGETFDGSANVLAHWRRMAEGGLYQSHTLVNPQFDRTRSPGQETDEDPPYLRVVAERDGGIVVRGAKMIGTAAAFGDEILVGVSQRMTAEDADHALSFSVPVSAPGVTFISRASFESRSSSVFDHPLASRFDENDAFVIYEDVFVPWERVFAYREPQVCHEQFWRTPAFVGFVHHSATRLWTKLEFLAGVAILVARANRSSDLPHVRAAIGRIMSWVSTVKALVLAAEQRCERAPGGDAVMPERELAYAELAVGPEIYPKVLEEIKHLAGGALIQLPASRNDLLEPDESRLLRRYFRTSAQDTESRVKLLKLAWDAVGSEFASRHDHYERLHHGAPGVYLPAIVREGDADGYVALAQRCLDGYGLTD